MIAATFLPQNRSTLLWILLVGVVGIVTLFMPWVSTDAAVYLPAAKAIASGQMPYRDFVHNYTPLVPIVFSWLFKMWLQVPYPLIHAVQQVVVVASAIGCFVFAHKRMLLHKRYALLLALLYYLAVLAQEGSFILLEPWIMLFIWPAMFFAGSVNPRVAFTSGVLVGLAFLVKQYGILYFIPMLAWWLVQKQWTHAAWASLGGIVLALFCIFVLMFYQIPIEKVWMQLLATNHQRMDTQDIFSWKTYVLGGKVFGWLLIGLVYLAFRQKKISPPYMLLFFASICILLLPTVYRHFAHYFILPLPFIFIAIFYYFKRKNVNPIFFVWVMSLPLIAICSIRLVKNRQTYDLQQKNAGLVAAYIKPGNKVFVPVEWSYLTVLNHYDMPLAPSVGYAFIKPNLEKHQQYAPVGSVFLADKPMAMDDSVQLSGQQKLYFYTNK